MKTGRDYKDVERLQYEIAPHSSYYAAVTDDLGRLPGKEEAHGDQKRRRSGHGRRHCSGKESGFFILQGRSLLVFIPPSGMKNLSIHSYARPF